MDQHAWDCRRNVARVILAAQLFADRQASRRVQGQGRAAAALLETAALAGRIHEPNDVDRTLMSRGCVGPDGNPPHRNTFSSIGADVIDRANTVLRECAAVAERFGAPQMPTSVIRITGRPIVVKWRDASGRLWDELRAFMTKDLAGPTAALVAVPHDQPPPDPAAWFTSSRLDPMRALCRAEASRLQRLRDSEAAMHPATHEAMQRVQRYVHGLPEGRVRQVVAENDGRGTLPVALLVMAAALVSDLPSVDRDAWVDALFGATGVPKELEDNAHWRTRHGEPSAEGGLFVPQGGLGQLHHSAIGSDVKEFAVHAMPRRQDARQKLRRCFESDVAWLVGCAVAMFVLRTAEPAMEQHGVQRGGGVLHPLMAKEGAEQLVRDAFMKSGATAWLWATASKTQ